MFTLLNKEELRKHLSVDEHFTKRLMLKEIRKKRDTVPSQNNVYRPSWNNTTQVDKDLLQVCTWFDAEDEDCECKACIKEHSKMENEYVNFKNELFELENTNELSDFIIINKKYLSSLLETKLCLIKAEVLFKKWKKSTTPIIAVNKFKSKLKSKKNKIN